MSITRSIEDLYSSLLFEDIRIKKSTRLVLLESPYCFTIDSTFLIHHITTFHLKKQHRVILVSFLNTFHHYTCIALKLGMNLASSLSEGNLVFIDCFSRSSEGSVTCPIIGEDNLCSLANLSICLQEFIEKHQQVHKDTPLTILIDDLSTPVLLGVAPIQVLDFVFSIRALLQAKLCVESSLCVLATSSGDIDGTEFRLVNHLSNESDVILTVQGLSSGFSKEVHGKLVALSIRPPPVVTPYKEEWHFKLEDRGVKLFPIGTAPGIL